MRLLNTATGQLEEFLGHNVPPYAALSHTWTETEVSLQKWSSLSSSAALPLPPDPGTDKILATCHLAAQEGLGHAWVDTCCIDKSSSAELSEAINSMHAWYARSAICYVHLADLDPGADLETALPQCRWFTRGWTLQELIAPARVIFFDASWTARAEKGDILDLLARITGIRRGVLSHAIPLAALPTAAKMAWAARRQTTRVEDAAYCLLGIFGINMPLLYGEQERAFRRLQEEIMRTTTDLSIFAWQLPASSISINNDNYNNAQSEFTYSGFLAPSPEAFYPCRITSKMTFGHEEEFSVTNCGIKTRIRIYLHMAADNPVNKTYLFPVQWDRRGRLSLGVRMKKCGADRYAREDPHQLVAVDGGQDFAVAAPEAQKFLLTDLPAADGSGIMTRAQLHALRGQVVQLYSVGAIAISDFWPAARCDSQQEVFFTGGNSWLDATVLCCSVWATGSAVDGSSIPTDHDVVVPRGPTFAFVCFVVGWAGERPPQVSLVAVGGGDEEGRGRGVVTEEFLRKMKSKDDGSARLRRHLRFMGVPRQREVRFGLGDGREVRVSYEVERAVDGDICEAEFWRVRVVSETRMVMEDYWAIDEGWGEVDGAMERALRTSSLTFNAKGKRRADIIEDSDDDGTFSDKSPDAKVARRLTGRGV